MWIEATFKFDLDDASKIEVIEFTKVMREYTIFILKLEMLRNAGRDVDWAGREYLDLRAKVCKALMKCFADNPVELDNLRWNTTHFVPPEEQALILAPLG